MLCFVIYRRSHFDSLACEKIRKLVVLKNFNPYYKHAIPKLGLPQIPTTVLSRAITETSLEIEGTLGVIPGRYFFIL